MSQYEELTTTMTDQQYLVEALTEMGYKPEVQTEGTALRGYGGVSWNRPVQVTIPKDQLRGALAAVGFGTIPEHSTENIMGSILSKPE